MTDYSTDKKTNLYLEVPYVEKEVVKKLGANWDPIKKKWFIPHDMDIELFKQWLPSMEIDDENMRADYFYLAQTDRNCYKCTKSTLVNAIILPEGFEIIDDYTMEELEKRGVEVKENLFCRQDYLSIISYITYISSKALEEIYKYVDYCVF